MITVPSTMARMKLVELLAPIGQDGTVVLTTLQVLQRKTGKANQLLISLWNRLIRMRRIRLFGSLRRLLIAMEVKQRVTLRHRNIARRHGMSTCLSMVPLDILINQPRQISYKPWSTWAKTVTWTAREKAPSLQLLLKSWLPLTPSYF